MKLSRVLITLAASLVISASAFGQSQAQPNHLIIKEGGAVQTEENGKEGEPKIVERMGEPGPLSPQNPFIIPLSPDAMEKLRGINTAGEPSAEQLETVYHTVWQQVSDYYNRPEKLAEWAEWKHKFDGKITTTEELENALQEMLSSLNDHWTSYTSTSDIQAARERFFNGIVESGIFVKPGDEGKILIHSLAYGTPAYKSVLRKNDHLIKIGDVDVTGKTIEEVEELARAKSGSAMKVTFERDGNEMTITLIMAPADQDGVQIRKLPGHLGYIRLDEFAPESAAKLAQGLVQLHMQSNGHLNGLILDLRGNPGGRVDLAKSIAEVFIKEGKIFSTVTRKERQVSEEVVNIIAPFEHEFAD